MVVKVYISGISGNKEVKKHQQRVLMILDSKNIEYVVVDITEPGKENEKEFMQQNSKAKEAKHPLPPQIFNDDDYCGDYEEFDLANEIDELDKFLKLSVSVSTAEITLANTADSKVPVESGELNGIASSRENSAEKEKEVVKDSKTEEEAREQEEEEEGTGEE
uniref:Glutaredoxin GRX-like domain containing protein n=1 Tax=Coptotermes formosanus TaxID=36987 RepID=R4UP66_COPFO|nr:glutaredoxin GRX-like domain containing protein [Coptotermes formosanus]